MSLFTLFPNVVMPILLLMFSLVFALSKRNCLDSFINGAKQGIDSCINLLPTLVLVMCAVGALFSSGAVDLLCDIFRPVLVLFGVPEEMLPTIILRPFSGSGVTAVADRMFKENGADSISSKIACLLMGSSDTIIYTLSIYFSASGIKRTRHALASSFIVFIFSILFCTFMGNLLYS